MQGYHEPVLLGEVLNYLEVKKDSWYLDCTLGDGGHSLGILKAGGNIVGLDVDPQALDRSKRRFEKEGIGKDRYKLIRGNFRDLKNLISRREIVPRFIIQAELKDQKFAGAIFDLGVSSLQLDDPARGFSFSKKGPLDMRMDPNLSVKALDLLKVLSKKELYEIFKNLGEEKYSWDLAAALERAGKVKAISDTADLASLAEKVLGRRRERKIHPATRIFQALRIAVNDELGALKEGLDQIKDLIQSNGCILVISFHSLEDRIVKNFFREWQDKGLGEVLTKKPIAPSDDEIRENPRGRSAKLRVFEIKHYDN